MISLTPKPKFPASTEARIGGRAVSIAVRVSERARSYRLSIPHRGGPVLTVPRHGRWSEAEAFLSRQTAWLEARLKRVAPQVPLAAGQAVPVRGVPHLVVPTGQLRGRVETALQDGRPVLLVPGTPEHQPRRLLDWLKAEAQADLEARVLVHTQTLGVTAKSVRLRSQSTRWGSCASTGRLNFNWRLILAPPFVLDYVAAHEVAHLLHMNHSPAFWAAVGRALPDMARGRAWLKAHGSELMAYGPD
ncbi:MAG TPA: SprT family zinc-dependent metalloprotease [Devosia sp.]|nr:SprT family zinc-dependent metalloprotease [Devosia sp.]